MWNRWRDDSAVVYQLNVDDDNNNKGGFVDDTVWDFGACSLESLLFGHDVEEAQAFYDEWWEYREAYDVDDDDAWTASGEGSRDPRQTNPCAQSQAYLDFLANLPATDARVTGGWDFVVLTDRTNGPKNQENRDIGIAALEETFLPLFQESGVTPIFMVTAAYWLNQDADDDSNVNTFENVPYWTVQSYEGYKQYAQYLKKNLPRSQTPRLVNMATAFLVVYEENPDMWTNSLFWTDHKHPSPYGSFLQTCLLHHVVYGTLPDKSVVIRDDMESLWDNTRTLMYPRDAVVPFPSRTEAEYLYDVCRRVARGYLPRAFRQEMKEAGVTLY